MINKQGEEAFKEASQYFYHHFFQKGSEINGEKFLGKAFYMVLKGDVVFKKIIEKINENDEEIQEIEIIEEFKEGNFFSEICLNCPDPNFRKVIVQFKENTDLICLEKKIYSNYFSILNNFLYFLHLFLNYC